MKKRFLAIALALLSALLLTAPCAQAIGAAPEDYIAANHTRGNGNPYYIMVNRAQSTVTVYGLDENNYYTVPVKAMICSTGRQGHATPLGTYAMGGKWLWVHMLDNSYGQYVSQISGNILFHSVCYAKRDPSTLITSEYNGLGAPASLGCVRLQTIDAKWIYENCARGTKITIYDGVSPGPLGKPEPLVAHISDDQANGWDPTDPREENPWHQILAPEAQDPAPSFTDLFPWCASEAVWAARQKITNGYGASDKFAPGVDCTQVQILTFLWRAENKPSSTATAYSKLAGDYAPAANWAYEKGMIDDSFNPDAPCTRSQAVSYIWQARGRIQAGQAVSFSDISTGASYIDAVSWAVENGVTKGYGGSDTFAPDRVCSRGEIVCFLYRAYNN